MPFDSDELVITRLRDVFGPNVKSRSDAAEVRRHIALTVNSRIVDRDRRPMRVTPFGKEIIGLRRRYLDALKSNLEARERYQRLSTKSSEHGKSSSQQLIPDISADAVLSQLESSALVRQYQELGIRSRYLHILSEEASHSYELNPQSSEQVNGMSLGNKEDLQDGITASGAEVKALTTKLEKAVLQANHQLERQKALLAKVKDQELVSDLQTVAIQRHARAIAATRDVLVAWLDTKLCESGTDHAVTIDSSNTPAEGDDYIQRARESISKHYQRYLNARMALLEKSVESSRQLSSQVVPNDTGGQADITEDQQIYFKHLQAFHAISQRLVPLLRQQADNSTFHTFSMAQISKERQSSLEVLRRLADESHLLSAYLNCSADGADELANAIEGWRTSADAAMRLANDKVHRHGKEILEALSNCQDWLADLRIYNGQDQEILDRRSSLNWRGMHGQFENNANT